MSAWATDVAKGSDVATITNSVSTSMRRVVVVLASFLVARSPVT
jgi:hypothetical protein